MKALHLGPLEHRIMERLWSSGASTVGEVLAGLNASAKDGLAYSTVMTVLGRLYDKGYLTRTQEGRRFRYAAATDQGSLSELAGKLELQRLIERHGLEAVAGFAADLSGADGELVTRLRAIADRDESESA